MAEIVVVDNKGALERSIEKDIYQFLTVHGSLMLQAE